VTSPERRAEAKERYTRANADHQDLLRRIEGQFGAERKAIARRHDQAVADMTAYKFTVWRRDRIGLIEVAKGDTWEEAFAQLEKRTERMNDDE
jgi:hypothetical protein